MAVSRTLLAAEEMVSVARSRAFVSDPLLLGRERDREPVLALPRVRLAAAARFAEWGLGELDDPLRDRDDRARLAAVACGLRPSLPLLPAFEAPCLALELDVLALEPRVLRDVAA